MELASYAGCITFWLPAKDQSNPREKEDGPYARDTYGELGRWGVRSGKKIGEINFFTNKPIVNIMIGAEPAFHGLSVIRKNLAEDHSCHDYIIPENLPQTLHEAVNLAKVGR